MSGNPLIDHEILKKRFPHASAAFIAANSSRGVPGKVGGEQEGSKPERAVRDEPVATKTREGADTRRFRVSVVSFRTRLIDPDNLTPKYFIDAARYAGLIPDDSADCIELSVTQKKDTKNPRTEITIEEITTP